MCEQWSISEALRVMDDLQGPPPPQGVDRPLMMAGAYIRQHDGSWALRPIEDTSDGSNCLSSLSAGDSFSDVSSFTEGSRSQRSRDGRPRRGPPSYTSDGSGISNRTMSDILRRPSRPVSTASSFARRAQPSSRASDGQDASGQALQPRLAQLGHSLEPETINDAILRHARRSNDYLSQNPQCHRRSQEYRESRKSTEDCRGTQSSKEYLGLKDFGPNMALPPQPPQMETPLQSAAGCLAAPEVAAMRQTPATTEMVLPSQPAQMVDAPSQSAASCPAALEVAAMRQTPASVEIVPVEMVQSSQRAQMEEAPSQSAASCTAALDMPASGQVPATAAVVTSTVATSPRSAVHALSSTSVCFPRALFGRLTPLPLISLLLWGPALERLGGARLH